MNTYTWISLYFKMVVTQMAFHPKLIHWSAVVHANLLLLRIISDPHTNVVLTAIAPDVVWHLKSDDQDPHVELPGSFSESMGPPKFVQPPDRRVVVGGIV